MKKKNRSSQNLLQTFKNKKVKEQAWLKYDQIYIYDYFCSIAL